MAGRLLVVDDDLNMCRLIEAALGAHGFEVVWVGSGEKALEILEQETFEVVLSDLVMPDMGGIELCRKVGEINPQLPVVLVTAFGSLESAIEAMRAGAYDFIKKPVEMDLLTLAVRRAVDHVTLRRKLVALSEAVEVENWYGELFGTSPSMRKLFDQITRIAESDAPALIVGESGTGKELVARELHRRSHRANGPFVAINCSVLPRELLESELFGHERGAFTDAKSARKGLLRKSDKGILLLDEIGDFPLPLQPKLLRALEEHSFRPVGSDREVHFDTRIIAATNKDLESAVKLGNFREDLFFRVNVIQLDVPPLRVRGNDILLMARHFAKLHSARAGKPELGISGSVAERLISYSWPGNVRELRNAVEHAVALARFDRISLADLPRRIRSHKSTELLVVANDARHLVSMKELEHRYISHVLSSVDGNKAKAARILGFDRKTLYRKLQEYDR